MADIPQAAVDAAVAAYAREAYCDGEPIDGDERVIRAALEAAAPLLAEAWGVKADDELRALFADLKQKSLSATAVESSVQRIVLDRSYQQVIGLGPRVIPLILEDMAAEPGHWFWALTALVGEDRAAGETTVAGAARKWLKWGREQGLIPGGAR